MTNLLWTPQAVEELEAIRAYVARDFEHLPLSLSSGFSRQWTVSARSLPESGRIVPEFQRADLRELIVGSYRIVYRLGDASVAVLTVFHGARLFPEGLRGAL